jgi:hypothetical protein
LAISVLASRLLFVIKPIRKTNGDNRMNLVTHRTIRPIALLVFSLTVSVWIAEAKSIVTVSCGEPTGSNFSYGSGPFGTGMKLKSQKDGFKGVNPVFIIEEAKPDTMLVIWGDTKALGSAAETKAKEAVIILQTAEQISAVERYDQGVWLYSLYPKLGIGYFSVQKHWLGGLSISSSYYSFCKFSR